MGEESLEVEEAGTGLDGAENIGQEGDRGDVGLGDAGLVGMLDLLLGFNKELGLLCFATTVSRSESLQIRLLRLA